jgi:hypothetical protein
MSTKEIAKMVALGVPVEKVADHFGLTERKVIEVAAKHATRVAAPSVEEGPSDKHICELYVQGMNQEDIGRQVGVGKGYVSKVLREHNIGRYDRNKEIPADIVDSLKTVEELAEEYEVSPMFIQIKMEEYGGAVPNESSIDHNYFKTLGDQQAWNLGFIFGCGQIGGDLQSVTLTYHARSMLANLADSLGDENASMTELTAGDMIVGYTYVIKSEPIVRDLMRYGISFMGQEWEREPLIPKHYNRLFVEGFLAGRSRRDINGILAGRRLAAWLEKHMPKKYTVRGIDYPHARKLFIRESE